MYNRIFFLFMQVTSVKRSYDILCKDQIDPIDNILLCGNIIVIVYTATFYNNYKITF